MLLLLNPSINGFIMSDEIHQIGIRHLRIVHTARSDEEETLVVGLWRWGMEYIMWLETAAKIVCTS